MNPHVLVGAEKRDLFSLLRVCRLGEVTLKLTRRTHSYMIPDNFLACTCTQLLGVQVTVADTECHNHCTFL